MVLTNQALTVGSNIVGQGELEVSGNTSITGNLILTGQGNIAGFLYSTTDGSSGYLMTTDGNKNISFVDVSGIAVDLVLGNLSNYIAQQETT